MDGTSKYSRWSSLLITSSSEKQGYQLISCCQSKKAWAYQRWTRSWFSTSTIQGCWCQPGLKRALARVRHHREKVACPKRVWPLGSGVERLVNSSGSGSDARNKEQTFYYTIDESRNSDAKIHSGPESAEVMTFWNVTSPKASSRSLFVSAGYRKG